MKKLICSVALLFTAQLLQAQTHHFVKLDATGTKGGSTWDNAYTDFQTAINNAASGDSLFVAQATYQPSSGTSFSMKEGVKIFGGFLGKETSFNQRNLANKPTLQGNGNSVISGNSLTVAAVLDDFIITGGNANTNTNGGHGGGGIYNYNASPTLRHLVVTGNVCNYYGGGVACINGSPLLENVIINNNTSSTGGGGISIVNATVTLRNVLISGNSAFQGGGLSNEFGSAILTNVTISGNTATIAGGIYAYSPSITINNSIVWGNRASNVNEISADFSFGGSMDLHHSLYEDAAGDIDDPYNYIATTDNNLTVSPDFVDSAGGNYQLTSTSPCIDAGTPDATGLAVGDIDLAGNARIVGLAIDIGAYEFDATLPVTLTGFTGKLQNKMANLKWQTGAEDNFNHFELQRSAEGNAFSTIATVIAKGDNSHYATNVSQTETTAYYRLKMVDNYGPDKFSAVVYLSQGTTGNKIRLYPNPARDYIHITLPQAGSLKIYDANGRLVKIASVNKGINRININGLVAGMYYLVVDGEKVRFEKIK